MNRAPTNACTGWSCAPRSPIRSCSALSRPRCSCSASGGRRSSSGRSGRWCSCRGGRAGRVASAPGGRGWPSLASLANGLTCPKFGRSETIGTGCPRPMVGVHQSRSPTRQSSRCRLAGRQSAWLRATAARARHLAPSGAREPADPPGCGRAGLRGRPAARLRPCRAAGLPPLRTLATRLRSRRLPGLSRAPPGGVADLLSVIRARLLRYLVRRHVVEVACGACRLGRQRSVAGGYGNPSRVPINTEAEGETRFLADDLAEREPALAQLAAAAVSGLPLAGPELRRKPLTVVLPAATCPKVVRPLCVEDGGFSLHAATRAGAEDDVGRTNLFNYVLRPPIAQEHVTLTADGLVAIQLKKPFRDGTVSVEMDPLSLVSRLATSVHPPRFHTVRYGGVLAPHATWRPLVIPPPRPPAVEDAGHSLPMTTNAPPRPPSHRCGHIPWHVLMLRTLHIDVETCPKCGGKLKLIALVQDPEGIARYLRHLGLPTEAPAMAAARGPPFWQSRVLRRRYGESPDAAEA